MELYNLEQKHYLMFYIELSSKLGVGGVGVSGKFGPPERSFVR